MSKPYTMKEVREMVEQEGFDYFFRHYDDLASLPKKLHGMTLIYRAVADELEERIGV